MSRAKNDDLAQTSCSEYVRAGLAVPMFFSPISEDDEDDGAEEKEAEEEEGGAEGG